MRGAFQRGRLTAGGGEPACSLAFCPTPFTNVDEMLLPQFLPLTHVAAGGWGILCPSWRRAAPRHSRHVRTFAQLPLPSPASEHRPAPCPRPWSPVQRRGPDCPRPDPVSRLAHPQLSRSYSWTQILGSGRPPWRLSTSWTPVVSTSFWRDLEASPRWTPWKNAGCLLPVPDLTTAVQSISGLVCKKSILLR